MPFQPIGISLLMLWAEMFIRANLFRMVCADWSIAGSALLPGYFPIAGQIGLAATGTMFRAQPADDYRAPILEFNLMTHFTR
jgi:hypothetical protein